MKKTLFIICIVGIAMSACSPKIFYISKDSENSKLKVQPAEVLEMAEELLDEHGTYFWQDSIKLETHIVLKGNNYYVKRSDYPAKYLNWYIQAPAIKINGKNGKVKIVEK